MSIVRDSWDQEQPDRSHATEPFVPHKVVRRSTKRLGHGALACPVCEVPVLLGGPMPISASLECPFCLSRRPARQFVRLDLFDTALNTVEVRARLSV